MSNRHLTSLVGVTGFFAAGCVAAVLAWYLYGSGGRSAQRTSAQPSSTARDRLEAKVAPAWRLPTEVETLEQAAISDEERKYLWDIEQHGNRLSQTGLSEMAKALVNADREALSAFLADTFTGAEPDDPDELRLDEEFAKVVRRRDVGHPPTPLNREQFLSTLLEYRGVFPDPGEGPQPKAKLSLMAFAPTVRYDLNSVWQGTCQLRMWGDAAPGKPAEVVLYLRCELDRPTKDAMGQGGWLRRCAITQSQLGTAPYRLLPNVAQQRGIDVAHFWDNWEHPSDMPAMVSGGVFVNDYNRNGILDLLVTDVNGLVFYEGQPDGSLKDVTREVGLFEARDVHYIAAFIDIDGDGWEDLVIGSEVFRNDRRAEEGDRKFVYHTPFSNLHVTSYAVGLVVADYNRDGRMDLYATVAANGKADSWVNGKNGMLATNQLWQNMGNWQFENVTRSADASGDNRSSFTAVWLDANNDGWPDLHATNEFGNGVLLINQEGRLFSKQLLVEAPGDFGSMGITAGDYDNDGNIDLYVGNMYSKAGSRVIANLDADAYPQRILDTMRTFVVGSQLHRNCGGLNFEQLAREFQVADVGWSYGPQLVDMDNDGWLDLHATCGFVSRDRSEPDG